MARGNLGSILSRSTKGGNDVAGTNKFARAVRKRAEYRCERCSKKPGNLTVHHHFGRRKFWQLRRRTWNGIALCNKCHEHLHTDEGRAERQQMAWKALKEASREAFEPRIAKVQKEQLLDALRWETLREYIRT